MSFERSPIQHMFGLPNWLGIRAVTVAVWSSNHTEGNFLVNLLIQNFLSDRSSVRFAYREKSDHY